MRRVLTWAFAAAVASSSAVASAHFPFLHLKREGGSPTLHVYFAESAEPDDPKLLDRLAGAEVWRADAGGTAEPLTLSKGADSLTAAVSDAGPAVYAFHKDYGVLSRGGETFALVYYAKTYSGPEAWAVRPGDRSRLDIVPTRDGETLTLTVLWGGKPLPDAEVVVQGGTAFEEGKTDADGRFTCGAGEPDLYSIRAKHVEEAHGERDGKMYGSVRHYATLTLEAK